MPASGIWNDEEKRSLEPNWPDQGFDGAGEWQVGAEAETDSETDTETDSEPETRN